MKLAEALVLRADAQKRLAQLKDRIHNNVLVQEGDSPAEDPVTLIAEFESVAAELEALMVKINTTNIGTATSEGTLMELLARRDMLAKRQGLLASVASSAVPSGRGGWSRYSRSEIKSVSSVNVADMQERADELSQEYRELDTKIQATNWTTDLQE